MGHDYFYESKMYTLSDRLVLFRYYFDFELINILNRL